MTATYHERPALPFPIWTRAVRVLVIAIAAAFLVEFGAYLARPATGDSVFAWMLEHLGFVPSAWFTAPFYAPLWQLGTYGFLHEPTSAWHLLGNLIALYFFGSGLEERLGTRRFVIAYFGGQFAGALVHLAAQSLGMPYSGPAIGASGAVFGVITALATLDPDRIVYWFFIPLRLKWLAIGIVGLAVFGAILDVKDGPGGVAEFIHLGGALYGFLAVKTGLVQKDPLELLERRRAVRAVERAQSNEARLDELLVKIQREGLNSLSRREREFLKKASARK